MKRKKPLQKSFDFMPSEIESISNKDALAIIERLIIISKKNKKTSSFWSREKKFLLKLYKDYDNLDFWLRVSFTCSIAEGGKLPSFLLFFDKDNNYWKDYLSKKWKEFNWKPVKFSNEVFDKNCSDKIDYKKRKRHIRDFFS